MWTTADGRGKRGRAYTGRPQKPKILWSETKNILLLEDTLPLVHGWPNRIARKRSKRAKYLAFQTLTRDTEFSKS